jgi:hypothetical protein
MFTLTKHPQDVDRAGQAGADLGMICVNRDQLKRSIIREIQDSFPHPFSSPRSTVSDGEARLIAEDAIRRALCPGENSED